MQITILEPEEPKAESLPIKARYHELFTQMMLVLGAWSSRDKQRGPVSDRISSHIDENSRKQKHSNHNEESDS
jgi:hypothetical protein